LGLLASLLAHMASYGSGHATGGAYHDAIVTLALAGAIGLAVALGVVAWFSAERLAAGSIIAARLTPLLPSSLLVTLASGLGFAVIEALEPRHAQAPVALVAAALTLAAFGLRRLASIFVRAIAHVVFVFSAAAFTARQPVYLRRAVSVARVSIADYSYRRFARPPPGFSRP